MSDTEERLNEFASVEDDVNLDLINLDSLITEIKGILQDFKNQCAVIETELVKEPDVRKKNEWFKIKNQIREKASEYYNILLSLLESKRKYREQQNDSLHKKLRYYNIELSKIEKAEGEGTTVSGLVSMMNTLYKEIQNSKLNRENIVVENTTNKNTELENNLLELEQDKYKI